ETLQGIVTDVCLKRKIRNYVDLSGQEEDGDALGVEKTERNLRGIFVRDSGVALNTKIRTAAEAVGATKDKKNKNRDSRAEMCRRYYDIRMFGGVLSTGDYNSGQVRGPMQLTFSRSIDPIVPVEMAITRVAITKEGENKETEIGRKASVPYGLYKGKGFFSPMLAKDTGVTPEDLKLFWTALANMFENDRSASRGDMQIREVAIFVHDNPLGNAPSGKLFGRLTAKSTVKAPREIGHYDVAVDGEGLPEGVTLVRLLG
ncbi:type I-C CRISPR-associated protein Cas7/Csd2, partial [bacterium]